MALPLANDADGGTNGTTVSTANSGGASGNAFDSVTLGTSVTGIYDSTVTPRAGGLSFKLTEPATAASAYLAWTTALGTLSTGAHIAGRIYLRFSTAPTATWSVFRILNGSTVLCGFRVTTGRVVQLEQSGSSVSGTASNFAMATNTWYRVEFDFTGVGTASGAGTARVFLVDATTQSGTDATTSAVSFGTLAPNAVRIGMSSSTGMPASSSFWLDDLELNSTGMPGPVVTSQDATLTPGVADLDATGSTPSVVVDAALAPGQATATASGSTPSVDVAGGPDATLTPGQASATASGSTPSVVVDAAVAPGAAAATASGSTPSVVVDAAVAPAAAVATAAGSTAPLQVDSALTPGQATATASGSTPGLSVDAVLVPGPAVATATGSTAGVTTDAVVNATVTPGAAAATAAGSTATIVITPDPVIPPPAPGGGGGDVDFGDETSIYGASVRLEPGPAVAWASGSFAEVVVVNAPRPVRIILPPRRQRPQRQRVVPKPLPIIRNQRVHAGTARAVASGSAARVEALSVLSQAEIEDLRGESEEDAVALLMLTS